MNRKLGQLIKAAIFTLPLALPGVALAQTATDTGAPPPSGAASPEKSNQGAVEQKDTGKTPPMEEEQQGAVPDSTGNINKEQQPEATPPAGSLDTGEMNKNQDENMNPSETTKKKAKKGATDTEKSTNPEKGNDINP